MVTVGDGVWMSFRFESILRLFHAATFTHIQDLDIAPSVHRVLGKVVIHLEMFVLICMYSILSVWRLIYSVFRTPMGRDQVSRLMD